MDRSRCPACSATLRPDAQWCSLCYLDLRPPPPQPPQPEFRPGSQSEPDVRVPVGTTTDAPISAATSASSIAAATSAAPSDGAAGWPCTACAAVVPLELDTCPHCGAGFLGHLAGDGGRHRSATTNGISRLPRPARLAAGLVSGVLIAVLIPVLLALLG